MTLKNRICQSILLDQWMTSEIPRINSGIFFLNPRIFPNPRSGSTENGAPRIERWAVCIFRSVNRLEIIPIARDRLASAHRAVIRLVKFCESTFSRTRYYKLQWVKRHEQFGFTPLDLFILTINWLYGKFVDLGLQTIPAMSLSENEPL